MRYKSKLAVSATLTLLFFGCDSGSSSDPGSQTVVFQGELVSSGSVSHPVTVTDAGVVALEVTDLRNKLLDVTNMNDTPRIGLGLGRPAGEECPATFRVTAVEGNRFPLGLAEAEYCVLIFDPGLPEDAVIEYTISFVPE